IVWVTGPKPPIAQMNATRPTATSRSVSPTSAPPPCSRVRFIRARLVERPPAREDRAHSTFAAIRTDDRKTLGRAQPVTAIAYSPPLGPPPDDFARGRWLFRPLVGLDRAGDADLSFRLSPLGIDLDRKPLPLVERTLHDGEATAHNSSVRTDPEEVSDSGSPGTRVPR